MELGVRDGKHHLIAPNAERLAQAALASESTTYGLFVADAAVGLISGIDPRLVDDEEERAHFQPDRLYVWRLMIDRRHRGRGFGTRAIDSARSHAVLPGLQGVSLTTMDQEAANAQPFYERLGFAPTGRRLDGEIELVRR